MNEIRLYNDREWLWPTADYHCWKHLTIQHPSVPEDILNTIIDITVNPMSDPPYFSSILNSIFLSDLLLIEVSDNQKVDTLIHIINHPSNEANLAPRIQIRAATNSSVKIFEEIKTFSIL